MSVIVHACRCGHPDVFHSIPMPGVPAQCPVRGCDCTAAPGTDRDPTVALLLPLWTTNRRPIVTVTKPGEANPLAGGYLRLPDSGPTTCACDTCWQTYHLVTMEVPF